MPAAAASLLLLLCCCFTVLLLLLLLVSLSVGPRGIPATTEPVISAFGAVKPQKLGDLSPRLIYKLAEGYFHFFVPTMMRER